MTEAEGGKDGFSLDFSCADGLTKIPRRTVVFGSSTTDSWWSVLSAYMYPAKTTCY